MTLELRPGPADLCLPSTLRELQSPVYRGEGLRLQRLYFPQSDSILHVSGTAALSASLPCQGVGGTAGATLQGGCEILNGEDTLLSWPVFSLREGGVGWAAPAVEQRSQGQNGLAGTGIEIQLCMGAGSRFSGFAGSAYLGRLWPRPPVCPTECLAWEVGKEGGRRLQQEHTGLDSELLL